MVAPPRLCILCKGGRALCGRDPCPLLARLQVKPQVQKISKDFFGPATSIFVGRQGYPNVFVGPMVAIDITKTNQVDSPSLWFGKPYEQIIELRSLILRSKLRQSIFSRSRFIQENQLLSLAKKPVETELNFKRKPTWHFTFSDIVQPTGPTAELLKLRIAENVHVARKVDRVVSDELRATEAAHILYKGGYDVYKITTILSSGILGLEQRKKLVPTRWSITAVDDIITKSLLDDVREFPSLNKYMLFESDYLSNHFVILLMPGNWEFENFEAWAPGSTWYSGAAQQTGLEKLKPIVLEEYEPFAGRTSYADKQGGGYYASRIAVVEYLTSIKRQARVVVFREVSEGYIIPLGVWVVRQTVRSAFKNKPIVFLTKKEALKYVNSRLRLSLNEYMKQSKILQQKRLTEVITH